MRIALLVISLALFLCGCGAGETVVPVATTTRDPVTRIRSATLGKLSGARLDSVARVTTLTGETPDATRHDLLVADASAAADPAVKSFHEAGKTVLFLNADAAAKASLTPLAVPTDSSVFAVRQAADTLELFDWPVATGDDRATFEGELASYLTEVSEPEAWTPPPGLVYANYSYRIYPPQPHVFHSSDTVQSSVPQVPAVKAHYQFKVFLVNTQYDTFSATVLVGANIEVTPFDPRIGLDSLLVNNARERAWIPVGMTLTQDSNYPSSSYPLDGPVLLSGPPTSKPNAGQVTTSLAVPITYNLKPGFVKTTFNTNAVRDLTDWQVETSPSGFSGQQWTYTSSDPYSGSNPSLWNSTGFGGGFGKDGLRTPNGQSLGTIPLKTNSQIVYGNGGLLEKTSFTGKLKVQFADIFIDPNRGNNINYTLAPPSEFTFPFNLDLSVINPPDFKLTFSPNPIGGLNSTTGTITLSSPARATIVAAVQSDGTQFEFPGSVTIPVGGTTATIPVRELGDGPSGDTNFSVTAGKTVTTTLKLN